MPITRHNLMELAAATWLMNLLLYPGPDRIARERPWSALSSAPSRARLARSVALLGPCIDTLHSDFSRGAGYRWNDNRSHDRRQLRNGSTSECQPLQNSRLSLSITCSKTGHDERADRSPPTALSPFPRIFRIDRGTRRERSPAFSIGLSCIDFG